MIPDRDDLEPFGYTEEELDVLDAFRPILEAMPADQVPIAGRELLRKLWPDEQLFIQKTHLITPKEVGEGIKLLKYNYAQERFYRTVIEPARRDKRPIRAIILKARQLGFSTMIQSWHYEQCERNPHRSSMTISYDDPSTEELFQKAKFIRNNSWFPPSARRDRVATMEFESGSTFYARTAGNISAGRGVTLHHVHCSEIPMWPDAGETLGAVMQSVPLLPSTSIIFESTAKGRSGEFYDAWQRASTGQSDFVPFFAPWFWDPEYRMDFVDGAHKREFAASLGLAERQLIEDHKLTLEQLLWRRWRIRNDLQGSEAKFRQEYPSSANEAFLTSGAPVFDADLVHALERNCIPHQWRGNIALQL